METNTMHQIPTYTPCVKAGSYTTAFARKSKGGMIDCRIRSLQSAQRSGQWADEIERLHAALPLLPGTVTRHCLEQPTLDTLAAEVAKVREEAEASLRSRAEELSAIVSAASQPKLNIPEAETERFSVAFCTQGEAYCDARIAWCKAAIAYESEYLTLPEKLRAYVPDADAFTLAPNVLRTAVVDKEIFAAMKQALTATDYDWISKIALAETKFYHLSDEECQNTVCAPYLTRLICIFKTCMLIEDKIEKDPVYGKRVYQEKKKCLKKNLPFIESSIFQQIKSPAVQDIFNCTEHRQCTF